MLHIDYINNILKLNATDQAAVSDRLGESSTRPPSVTASPSQS